MRHSERRSVGDMISTFCFAGMSVKLALDALSHDGSVWGSAALGLCAAASALGAARFAAARLWHVICKSDKNE